MILYLFSTITDIPTNSKKPYTNKGPPLMIVNIQDTPSP